MCESLFVELDILSRDLASVILLPAALCDYNLPVRHHLACSRFKLKVFDIICHVSREASGVRTKSEKNSMLRKTFFWLLVTVLLAIVSSATAQQPKKVPRIGFLHSASASSVAGRREAFQQGLRELGYVAGNNIFVEYRFGAGEADRIPLAAAELVQVKVEVLVTGAASRNTRSQGSNDDNSNCYGGCQ